MTRFVQAVKTQPVRSLGGRTLRQCDYIDSVVAMSSEQRLRRALQNPRCRAFFRRLTCPFLFDCPDRLRDRGGEVLIWLAERGIDERHTHMAIPFDRRNFGKNRYQILFTDVIDFPSQEEAVEFRMVWL
jgi:hypothetical protein